MLSKADSLGEENRQSLAHCGLCGADHSYRILLWGEDTRQALQSHVWVVAPTGNLH